MSDVPASDGTEPGRVAFNHVGQCVTDLERSKRFYMELLDFGLAREINPPDDLSAPLMGLTPPLALTATYLTRNGLVLELLHFAAPGQTRASRARTMNEPGLTHLSLSVEDVDAVLTQVPEYGGQVLPDTNIGHGVFIRDPDGQLVELLPMSYRRSLEVSP
jgi:lactoylglutathione lyase